MYFLIPSPFSSSTPKPHSPLASTSLLSVSKVKILFSRVQSFGYARWTSSGVVVYSMVMIVNNISLNSWNFPHMSRGRGSIIQATFLIYQTQMHTRWSLRITILVFNENHPGQIRMLYKSFCPYFYYLWNLYLWRQNYNPL